MKKDTASHVKKLAEFMGCSFTLEEEEEGEVQKIISLCSFEKLSNLAVNKNGKHRADDSSFAMKNGVFFRKGEIGDWANNLTAEMGARLDDIMEQKLKGSGLKLPSSSLPLPSPAVATTGSNQQLPATMTTTLSP
ncbi:hypothetical protein OIU78_024653 [Salix suchowensis]|nr:hypothetical protein OIU78_024653 [Salix suchowensis]